MRPLVVALLFTLPVLAADPLEKRPALDEQIKAAKLTDAEAKALKDHGFVVGGKQYDQVFDWYRARDVPAFVTADSLLNAFHVLFAESMCGLERANARTLPLILADVEERLPAAEEALVGDAELTRKATKRARVFLGVALNLLDPRVVPADADTRKLVEAEVKRVEAEKVAEKPDWLGKPDDGFKTLDYSRFTPRGFYTTTPKLERYFRAVSWLQAIPWRVDNDEEFAAILLLAKAYGAADRPGGEWMRFWSTIEQFCGTGDDWHLKRASLFMLKSKPLTADELSKTRKWAVGLAGEKGGPQINDQLRFQSDTPDGKAEPHFRFLPARRLPDAVLFRRTATAERMPSGLDVAAALGSPFARGKLKMDAPEVLKKIDANATLFPKPGRWPRPSLHADYLDCLRALLEVESDAPKVFQSEAWSAKTCQTALGGWAQMRHPWAVQAKESEGVNLDGWGLEGEPGFVEPVPEFYGKFAELAKRSQRLFEEAGAFGPDPDTVQELSAKVAAAAVAVIPTAWKFGLATLTDEERNALTKLIPELPASGDPAKDAGLARTLLRAEWEAEGVIDADAQGRSEPGEPRPKECWPRLEAMSAKLETLAHKQLRGKALRADEKQSILDYGKELPFVMFYGDNSYLFPNDDAPRVVDVHRQRGKSLEVGIGRPRVLWVVYPWKGSDVLCRGAVLPYHEFASAERLTDQDWLKRLDSSSAPDQPKWVRGWTVPKK